MPERPEDFEDAWARIVEDLTSEGGSEAPPDEAPAGSSPTGAGNAEAGLTALFEPLRRAEPQPDPAAFVDNWQDEGHFTPPPPPELPEGTPISRLAWAGLLGGPAVLLLIALTGWDGPRIVSIGAGLATLAGFVTLVWLLPESRDDGWDDGARL
jgi:hypothetical protein